jgi:nucleoside 2-deoxyribosyltransferase
MKKRIYIAGGLGFSEMGQYSNEMFKKKIGSDFILIDPFKESSELGQKILDIGNNHSLTISEAKEELIPINYEIGQKNEELIRESDFLIANLDGSDVDSGTAAEIGFAYAIGKKIFGYRGDFRCTGDNLGSNINIQVEYFIKASKGSIFQELEKLLSFLENMK